MRVMIVDGELEAIGRLSWLCRQLAGVEVVGSAADGDTALDRIAALAPDVLLLDIAMPGLDGLAFARSLAGGRQRPAIVVVTAHRRHAVAAFEAAAIDYLLKPVPLDRLRQAFGRVAAPEPSYLREIWAPHGREVVRLGVGQLELLEAERDYVRLHARGRSYLVRATVGRLERRLDPRLFLRVHRSAIVPVDRIGGLRRDPGGRWTILLSMGQSVRVGRSFERRVRSATIGGPDLRTGRA